MKAIQEILILVGLTTSLAAIAQTEPAVITAVGNADYVCNTRYTEFAYHTEMHGAVAVADYAILRGGQRRDFSTSRQIGDLDGDSLVFRDEGRIFRVTYPLRNNTMLFTVEVKFFGDSTVLEEGHCSIR